MTNTPEPTDSGGLARSKTPKAGSNQSDNPREAAQAIFDILMDYAMSHQEIPVDVLEAMDYVANYCGDIAHGRNYKPGKFNIGDTK